MVLVFLHFLNFVFGFWCALDTGSILAGLIVWLVGLCFVEAFRLFLSALSRISLVSIVMLLVGFCWLGSGDDGA